MRESWGQWVKPRQVSALVDMQHIAVAAHLPAEAYGAHAVLRYGASMRLKF